MRSEREPADLSVVRWPDAAYRLSALESQPRPTSAALAPSLHDLRAADWVRSCGAAWLDRDWERLERFMSRDVQLRLHRQRRTLAGPAQVIAYLSDFLSRARVTDYSATDLHGGARADGTGFITYRWYLEWMIGNRRRASAGKDRLSLAAGREGWLLRTRSVWVERPGGQ